MSVVVNFKSSWGKNYITIYYYSYMFTLKIVKKIFQKSIDIGFLILYTLAMGGRGARVLKGNSEKSSKI